MNVENLTTYAVACTTGLDPDGREHLVAVAKVTFDLPKRGDTTLALAEEQQSLVMADEFAGEPGLSPVLRESDMAPRKPRCDVLFVGFAHAPKGRPVDRLRASLRVNGLIDKTIEVTGPRVWTRSLAGPVPTTPLTFTEMPLHYGLAYGGTDIDPKRPDRCESYAANPIGVGFYPLTSGKALEGKPIASLSVPGQDVTPTSGPCMPVAFGCIGRNFAERVRLAGTYDAKWLDDTFPFLPSDFKPAYFQAAARDQQMPTPHGGETVELINLTPLGRETFELPTLRVPVLFARRRDGDVKCDMAADTIVISGEARTVSLTYRASVPISRSIFDVQAIVIGQPSRAWLRAKQTGRKYYPSLSEAIRHRRMTAQETATTDEANTEEASS